ncbi:acyl-CoA dehydrogenase family protein [Streptomyces abikoensis]|uniref:acyl-CoA dehydrogenase family protein n=1 Tax=Streptomyces abikoensis TaxID=97398 RepID=UPI00167439F4|nr:acyl-CoA dehydrogenase family protein [Streptomyces abikoensis]GGP76106.1 hypothetical protein GCM10010214_59420 [Streptomyces abikoensis]
MLEIRRAAIEPLGWSKDSVFPKIAAVGAYQPGRLATRAISVPSWHPTLALTGATCLAAATTIPGTVPARLLARANGSPQRAIARTGRPSETVLDALRSSGTLGAAVPAEFGGLDGDARLTNRLVEEVAALDPSVAIILFQHYAVSAHHWSAYEGWTFTGRPDLTVRRGEVIWDGREAAIFGSPQGTWLDARVGRPTGLAVTR